MTTLTHSSYQEARIQNNLPVIEIYQLESNGRFFSANVDKDKIYVREFESHATKCNPADHCMSLEAFFEAGHKFVDGDAYLDESGTSNIVGDLITADFANSRDQFDDERFVLSAKALEDNIEQVEWNYGDECIVLGEKAVFIGYSASDKSNCIVEYLKFGCYDVKFVCISVLSKPETPEQKKEREELEAAYDLYTTYQSAYGLSCMNIDKFKYCSEGYASHKGFMAIVNKTGYRKPE